MNFLFSSLGKKFQIAFSGIILCLFLLMHLINNMALFVGPETFNAMVGFLESIKPFIRLMELGLLLVLLIHIINAIQLTISNKTASSGNYLGKNHNSTSTVNSRTMIISGTVILVFFIIHLRYLWYSYQAHLFYNGETYYDVVMRNQLGYLGHTPTAAFYIVAIFLIAFHLKHGFQSALKTFGILESSKWSIIYKLSFVFWGIIPGLFIVIVLAIQIGFIK